MNIALGISLMLIGLVLARWNRNLANMWEIDHGWNEAFSLSVTRQNIAFCGIIIFLAGVVFCVL